MFHGCIPLDFYGNFIPVDLGNQKLAGKKYFDYLDRKIRSGYFEKDKDAIDLYWLVGFHHFVVVILNTLYECLSTIQN